MLAAVAKRNPKAAPGIYFLSMHCMALLAVWRASIAMKLPPGCAAAARAASPGARAARPAARPSADGPPRPPLRRRRYALMNAFLCKVALTVATCRAQLDPGACSEGSECRELLDGDACSVPESEYRE